MFEQCIHAVRDQPAMRRAAFALVIAAWPLAAQTTIRAPTPLLATPNGRELATIRGGAVVRVAGGAGAVRQGHTQVTLDGFIDASLLGAGRDSFPNVVKAPSGARLRREGQSDATVDADLRNGMGVTIISRAGSWVRVRRTGWVATPALSAVARSGDDRGGGPGVPAARSGSGRSGAPPREQPPSVAAVPPTGQDLAGRAASPTLPNPAPPPGALTSTTTVQLRASPDGRTMARIDSGAFMTALARETGWTQVRVEGWVRDDEVIPADTALRLTLSGADVRAAPEKYRGTIVRWDVEFIAVQRADQLRRDLRSGEPYLLARGPGRESGLLYIAIPPTLVAQMERFQPLQVITVTARIRVGRSEPAGVPVLDLLSAVRK